MKLTGYFQVISASIVWGSIGIFARAIDLPATVLNFYRFFFGALIFIAFYFLNSPKKKQKYVWDKKIFLQGFLTTITVVTFFVALSQTSIANTVILQYVAPVYIAILALFLFKEKMEKITLICLILSVIGIILIASPQNINLGSEFIGIFSGILSGIFYALTIINAKSLSKKYSGIQINQSQFFVIATLLFPFIFFTSYTITVWKLFLLVIIGCIHSALAFALFVEGMKNIKTQHIGIISYFEPLSAV